MKFLGKLGSLVKAVKSGNSRIQTYAPIGHFYSPVVDVPWLESRVERIWNEQSEVLGVDFNDISHQHILTTTFPRHINKYRYSEKIEETDNLQHFYTRNSQFSWLDSRAFFVLMCDRPPRRLIEVGSGFSTLLAAEVNRNELGGRVEITCIEPYPRAFLRAGIPGVSRLIERQVQDVPLVEFSLLEDGDILFIDSSHVAKTGSDVNFLYFEVLPRLKSGVRIHIHDIFMPNEYPREWVLGENRSWNEQYLLRALLMYSTAFQVEFSCSYAYARFPDLVSSALARPVGKGFGGGSIWLKRL